MKRQLLIVFFATGCFGFVYGQGRTECDFLKQAKFRNGRDTITLQVLCQEVGKALDKNILHSLQANGILKERDFGYSLFFKPLDCDNTYGISSSDRSKEALTVFRPESAGKVFVIRCIVFRDIKVDGRAFFIIDKIRKA